MHIDSEFIFTACQVGAEKALKDEILQNHPELRFAFSRPGFVTFKSTKGPVELDIRLNSVFARVYGVSFPVASKDAQLASALSVVSDLVARLRKKIPEVKPHFHIWERDQYLPGDEPRGFIPGAMVAGLRNLFLGDDGAALTQLGFEKDHRPSSGDLVVQMIQIDPDRIQYGVYEHSADHSEYPGGRAPLVLPEEAPSRAYLKLEEVLLWSRAPLQKGDTALEMGSAPGGACFSLLKRGLKVVGVDPAVMAPVVARHPNFMHLQVPIAQVHRGDLPDEIHWILQDMNIDPGKVLTAVDRLASRMKDTLLGCILTVKLNEWKWAKEIPSMLAHLKAVGFVELRAAQLSLHRQEIVICGLTKRGVARAKGQSFKVSSKLKARTGTRSGH